MEKETRKGEKMTKKCNMLKCAKEIHLNCKLKALIISFNL